MKLTSLNFFIAALAAITLFGCKPQNAEPDTEAAVKSDSTKTAEAAGLKVAFIYGDSINQHYKFLIDAQAELEQEQARMDRQMQNKLQKAQARASELQKQAPTMTQAEMQQAQLELQNLDLEMQQQQEKLTTKFRKRENELQVEYVEKIDDYLDDFNSDGRYDMIFNYQQGGNLIWIKKGFNITGEVLKGLNEQYQAQLDSENETESK